MRGLPRTERARLTALYGLLLLASGAMLVCLVFYFTKQGLQSRVYGVHPGGRVLPGPYGQSGAVVLPSAAGGRPAQTVTVHATLQQLFLACITAFLIFTGLSVALAWWVAGRVLRPVRLIATTARRLSADDISERINLSGPPGDLKNLADTFDRMLDRIERMVEAQRRFAGNAAHELRTFLAVQRTAVDVGLADPAPESVARIRRTLLPVSEQSEHLIESLIELAAIDRGLEHAEPVALHEVVGEAVSAVSEQSDRYGIRCRLEKCDPVVVRGDRALLSSLVKNLIQNGMKYYYSGGSLTVWLAGRTLEVSNTGPIIDRDEVPYLFEPFRRRRARTRSRREGAGLGLSIVSAIVRAHHADLSARANPAGGLTVTVTFPATSPPRQPNDG